MATTRPKLHLLTLPYDIRHQIYAHLFPPSTQQIYVLVHLSTPKTRSKFLQCLLPPSTTALPTSLLLTCHHLHLEASEYLYNTYLFNLVGTKPDCLAHYKGFLRTMEKYARQGREVKVDAFSNGGFSSTMCVSMQVGEGKVAILNARQRGERRSLEELEREVLGGERLKAGRGSGGFEPAAVAWAVAVAVAVAVVLLGWLVQNMRGERLTLG